ncbi:tetratricopeptide repeat protein [Mesorhizobium sp. M00.F.Ca.ET.220.01.1.1]|uniref:tetratricopeptide repeat protein n=1 Tax=Mesorhizobium sp. M00.F.Ca.ET.220.01.1.1 TaxID=2500531 RepID=UPI002478BE03|nr:tetratricopeptide repeat protein [Mesorhizobium sp. M00.F.Ca.ET.220.01.1.1]
MADYDQAIRLDPTLANAYNNRGSAWAHKGGLCAGAASTRATEKIKCRNSPGA